jgi:hypothetical protein
MLSSYLRYLSQAVSSFENFTDTGKRLRKIDRQNSHWSADVPSPITPLVILGSVYEYLVRL